MGTVVFAWELGANFGHLSPQLGTALELRRQGHDVLFVVCDCLAASQLLDAHGFRYLPAPSVRRSVPMGRRIPLNYASLLAMVGYTEPKIFRALLQGWLHLLRQLRADVIVVDHSPTSLLAARILAVPAVQLGAGFFIPPAVDPLPSLQPWVAVPTAELARTDAAVLTSVNTVLRTLGFAELDRLGTLFANATALLRTFPELDHYGSRSDVRYVGPLSSSEGHPRATWPQRRGPRILAYLRASMARIQALLGVLRSHQGHVICVIPDAPLALRQQLAQSGVDVYVEPINLSSVLEGCDLVVTHGGTETVAQSLLASVPVLLVPQELDQSLLARRVMEMGAGLAQPGDDAKLLRTAIARLTTEPGFKRAASAFASGHADFDGSRAAIQVACVISAAGGFEPAAEVSQA